MTLLNSTPALLLRTAKTAMVAAIAVLFSIIAFGNITDYGTNFAFVQHVMSMDTLFPTTMITYRAITSPLVHHIAYNVIIATEILIALLCWLGALALLRSLRAPAERFRRAKSFAIAGLALGFLLYQFGFITIGGEWFGMWMSQHWNGVQDAFHYLMITIAVLIFVTMPEGDIASARVNHASRARCGQGIDLRRRTERARAAPQAIERYCSACMLVTATEVINSCPQASHDHQWRMSS
jgi:predicted small integral membrane protein